ncbi:MAG: DUF2683 family protein [Nanoarchaeota archaeon]|nr:DUF2683 family protein [Nanoarchaeota archaeon]MBU1269314.1 DUF2683 family protein [Nanoarchaeota archaeon]MBU1603725.1 DUF2683 family protein [Nanoarchaeota archaeon]MBU2443335.1 DUF2683 family protein [Nanoarchaeota archaeon]
MKALLDIPQEVNQTLNIIKAQHNLKNKVEAISLVVNTYKEQFMEPELRPEFVKKILKSDNKKGVRFKSIEELRKRIEQE